jgi:hypothetical protein
MKIGWDETTQSLVITPETAMDCLVMGLKLDWEGFASSRSETSCKTQSDHTLDTHKPETEGPPAEQH